MSEKNGVQSFAEALGKAYPPLNSGGAPWMARPRLWESFRLQLLGDEVVLTDNVVEDDVIGTGSNLNVSTILDTDAYGEAL